MPDLADDAAVIIDRDMAVKIHNARNAIINQPPVKGSCYNCSEPLTDKRFCDEDCASDYEKRNR